MDMHQKEQLHDNPISMMQSQHYPVSHGFCVEHSAILFIYLLHYIIAMFSFWLVS